MTVTIRKRQEAELEMAKMLRLSLRVTRTDRIWSNDIRGQRKIDGLDMDQRRESEYISGRMLRLEVASRSSGGRAKERFVDVAKENMTFSRLREEDEQERVRSRQMPPHPLGRIRPKEEKRTIWGRVHRNACERQ